MGRYSVAILCVLLLLATTTVNASISGITCDDDHDGAIVMKAGSVSWGPVEGEYQLSWSCSQFWRPGHVQGDITAPDDPTLRIIEDVTNDTWFDWTDYHITIGMSNIFTIGNPSGLVVPAGWTATVGSVVAGTMPNGGSGYIGTIDYYIGAGAPVAIGDTGTFGFKVTFIGSIAYCTQQVPTPEPATIGLLGLGAVALLRRKA
jgi:hypothetical protein